MNIQLIVDFSLCVGVEVSEETYNNNDYTEIAKAAKAALLEKVNSGDLGDNITFVEKDDFA